MRGPTTPGRLNSQPKGREVADSLVISRSNLACKYLSGRAGYKKVCPGDPVFLARTTEAANNPWQAKQLAQRPQSYQQPSI